MLYQIQKELTQKRKPKISNLVEKDIAKYELLKLEFKSLPEKNKKILNPQLQVYFLFVANLHDDLVFAEELIRQFDYDEINNDMSKLALGRFYTKCGLTLKAVDYFLPLLNKKLLNELDLDVLFKSLHHYARHSDCDSVLQYALETYPECIGWKIEALTYQIMLCHRYPKQSDSIINNLKYLYPRCQTSNEYNRMAICFFMANYVVEGIQTFGLAFQKLIPALSNQKKPIFDSAKCKDSMDQIIEILSAAGIKAFPAFGSLLGLVRDGKLMAHDKDADIGIFVNSYDEIYDIVSMLCKLPEFVAPSMINESKESHLWNIPIYDLSRWTGVDLFFFYRQKNHIETGIYNACGIFKWQFIPFELSQRELGGKLYWVPENAEHHLTELYSEWQYPVEIWDSLLNCPNLIPTSQPAVLFYGLMRLYDVLNSGSTKKALNYYETLTNRWGMRFSAEADMNIQKILSENIQ